MQWSIEYEIAALVTSVLLLLNLRSMRVLPMRSGKLFVNLLFLSLAVIVSDIAATGMDMLVRGKYLGLQMTLNTIYFAFMLLFFFSMRMYCSAVACEWEDRYYRTRVYSVIVYMCMNAVLVANFFTGILFDVTKYGYMRGWGYYYFIFPYIAVEICAGLIQIINARRYMPRRVRYSMFAGHAIMILVSYYQVYIEPGRLLMSAGISISLVIIYLSMVNSENDNELKTDTYNTKGFRRYMTERILKGDAFTAFFMQIEGYSSILSVFGRSKTDILLREIGRDLIRREKLTFYLHTGLFAVVETNEDHYEQTKEYIDTVLHKDRLIDGEKADLSFRTETVTDECGFDYSAEMLTVACDSIRAKNYDKKPYDLITKTDVEESEQKNKLNRALYRALKNDGVRVFYQPIYDNYSDQIHSAEALARIYDKDMGLIFPDDFIPVFERDGTILKFGKIIFENVCRFIRDNDMDALGLEYIEVNLSPMQCMQRSLPDDLIQIADRYHVDMKYLNFEITETASLSAERLIHLMSTLIGRGASFSVDDFGTGYSNIIRVTNLPFKIIKIDKSILWDYFRTKDEMVPRIYDMMHSKGFAMVTEGVETEDMHYWLKNEAKCQYEQGYLYSKPVDEQSFIEYLRQHQKILA